MHTATLIVSPVERAASLNRGTPQRPTTVERDRPRLDRRRLFQALAGPANTPSIHRPPRTGRHERPATRGGRR
jgi:hypothetical protein